MKKHEQKFLKTADGVQTHKYAWHISLLTDDVGAVAVCFTVSHYELEESRSLPPSASWVSFPCPGSAGSKRMHSLSGWKAADLLEGMFSVLFAAGVKWFDLTPLFEHRASNDSNVFCFKKSPVQRKKGLAFQ